MEFLKIWEIIVRRKRAIIITFSIFIAIVVIGSNILTPIYESKAKIYIESSDTLSSLMSNLGLSIKGGQAINQTETYSTEIALITARPLLEKLISNLDIKARDGETLKPDDLIEYFILNNILPRPYIEVKQYEDSDVLEIISSSTDATQATNMSNGLARLFIDNRLEHVRNEYKSARIFIENHIKDVKEEYYKSLLEMKDFMIQEKTVDLEMESRNLLEYITSLKEELRRVEVDISGKKAEFTEQDLDVAALIRQRDMLREYINNSQADLMGIAHKTNISSKLELSLTVYQATYQTLLEYLTQVGIAESMTLSNIKLIEPAVVPDEDKPAFPKKSLNYILGIFLGSLLSLAYALFIEYIDHTIKGAEDLEKYDFTFLGAVPNFKQFKGTYLISNTDPNDPVYEAYRKIHATIHFATIDKPPKKLLIASIGTKSGSSVTAANLGILHANEGQKVLLVDADLRRPNLHNFFGLPGKKGLTDLLMNDKNIEGVVLETGINGLQLLAAGPKPPNPGLLLKSGQMKDVISDLEKRYDLILFHCAPLLIKHDAFHLMKNLDDMAIVFRNKVTTYNAVSKLSGLLENAKITPIGTVLNCV